MQDELYIGENVIQWIRSIDEPGRILVVMDAEKGCSRWAYHRLMEELRKNTKHLVFRMGGNSYRSAKTEFECFARDYHPDADRFEFYLDKLPWDDFPDLISASSLKLTRMRDLDIDAESEFGQYAIAHDVRRTTVEAYLRELKQARQEGREFSPFGQTAKGAWSLADIVMIRGYGDIPPATDLLTPPCAGFFTRKRAEIFADCKAAVKYVIPYHGGDRGFELVTLEEFWNACSRH